MTGDGGQLELATEVTAAWLTNPHTRADADEAAAMLGAVSAVLRRSFSRLAPVAEVSSARLGRAAVNVRQSLASPDHILSLIDGKPYRSLTRHLRTHGLTPDEYRQRYGLKPDYPMVAPSYAAERSAAAKKHNFGRPRADQPDGATIVEPEQKRKREPATRRKGIAEAKRAARVHLGIGSDDAAPASTEQ